MQAHKPPDALTTVTFGDKPSGAISILALRNTAKMSIKRNPEVVDVIMRNTYVDILDSVNTRVEADEKMKAIENTLEVGGFKIKH